MTEKINESIHPFLSKVSDHIIEKYANRLNELCIVFPNRRAGLFLKKNLADKLQRAFWSPTILSIEDFICQLADRKISDNIRLLIELYQVHKKVEKGNARTFDEFLKWGEVLLSDFNEVDLYLVNAGDLFGYLSESKAISLWNTNGQPLTEYQLKYLKLYKSLATYYKELSLQLEEKKIAYQGMVYRHVAENIDNIKINENWYKIIFVGFNALTPSEEKIIKKLTQSDKAEVLWDADRYYFDSELQEAGSLLRQNLKTIALKEFNWLSSDYQNSIKDINIIGAVNSVSQVKIAGNIIKDLLPNIVNHSVESLKTAIVLVDENLLIPLLYSLPSEVSQLNITMGYPLRNTPIFSFFDIVFTLHENAKRLGQTGLVDKTGFYFKDLVKLFAHPYMIGFLIESPQSIIETIVSRNKVFWNKQDILSLIADDKKELEDIFNDLLGDWIVRPYESFQCMARFVALLQKNMVEEIENKNNHESDFTFNVELECLFSFSRMIDNLQFSLNSISAQIELKTLHSLFNQCVSISKLPFYGEPLKGLQVMGLLETRTLDFDNLIMLSVNEGLLPSGKTGNSLIPFDIKREFNLATYKDHDSIFAYHFYRLLQRAKNIYLIYNTQTDEFGKGERSRFISQILYELPRYNPKISISESIVSALPEKQSADYSISIAKNDHILSSLFVIAKDGFSPSAINNYRSCKLKFYFQNLLKIKEVDSVMENIDAVALGIIMHHALQKLYEPYVNKIINKPDYEKIQEKVEEAVLDAFLFADFSNNEINYGKNHLIFKVAIKLINNYLQHEINLIEGLKKQNAFLSLQAVEKSLNKEIKTEGYY